MAGRNMFYDDEDEDSSLMTKRGRSDFRSERQYGYTDDDDDEYVDRARNRIHADEDDSLDEGSERPSERGGPEDDEEDDDEDPAPRGKKKSQSKATDAAVPKARIKSVLLTWGDEKIGQTLSHFKCVMFKFEQNGVRHVMQMFFAHPNSEIHLQKCLTTFEIQYLTGAATVAGGAAPRVVGRAQGAAAMGSLGSLGAGADMLDTASEYSVSYRGDRNGVGGEQKGIALKFIFSNADRQLDKVIMSYIERRTAGLSRIYHGTVTDKSIMVASLEVSNVNSTLKKPMAINVEGIRDKYTVPHTMSWAKNTPCLSVLTPGTQRSVIYETDLHSDPDVSAIHGIHAIENDESIGALAWGTVKENHVQVVMPSGRYLWLMYHLPYLLTEFVNKNTNEKLPLEQKLPAGISVPVWKDVQSFKKKHPLPNIYSRKTDLEDEYITKLLALLKPRDSKSLMWAVVQDELWYRVPLDFMYFVIDQYKETTQLVKMAKPDSMWMRANAVQTEGDEPFKPSDKMTFTVLLYAFTPCMHFMATPIKPKKRDS
jgi:hypothetical protein